MALARPTLVAFAPTNVINHRNDYFWPLIVTDTSRAQSLTIGLGMFVQSQSGADWTLPMAVPGFVCAPLLLVFAIFQRQFTQSFIYSRLKG